MKKEENGEILKTKPPKGEKSATSEKLEMRKKAREKLPSFPEPKPGEDISSGGAIEEGGDAPVDDIQPVDLEKICGDIWVLLYKLGGVLKKDFEPLTPDVKKILSPVSARLAEKYHVESYMKDEVMLAGILGIDLTTRLMKKPKEEKK